MTQPDKAETGPKTSVFGPWSPAPRSFGAPEEQVISEATTQAIRDWINGRPATNSSELVDETVVEEKGGQ